MQTLRVTPSTVSGEQKTTKNDLELGSAPFPPLGERFKMSITVDDIRDSKYPRVITFGMLLGCLFAGVLSAIAATHQSLYAYAFWCVFGVSIFLLLVWICLWVGYWRRFESDGDLETLLSVALWVLVSVCSIYWLVSSCVVAVFSMGIISGAVSLLIPGILTAIFTSVTSAKVRFSKFMYLV